MGASLGGQQCLTNAREVMLGSTAAITYRDKAWRTPELLGHLGTPLMPITALLSR